MGHSPLMKFSGWDQPCLRDSVMVPGLPPHLVLLAHDLEDVAPLKCQTRQLTWDRWVVFRIVVKESSDKGLAHTNVGTEMPCH